MTDQLTLRLSQCKCFEGTTIKFAPITVLTGINSGGKTTIIAVLLLLKQAADAFIKDARPGWPAHIGGIRIGAFDTFLRFGSDSNCEVCFDESEAISLRIFPHTFEFLNLPIPQLLRSRWRVCSTVHLPLCVEQDVSDHSTMDSILDLKHALLELLEYELKRKPGSLANEASVRSTVERILSSVTSPIQIELTRTDLPDKLRLMYRGNSIESEPTSPEQTGAGITAALPLIVHLVAAVAGEVLVIQDPEAHLHPKGQSQIGREIARCARRGIQVIVETHSEHVFNGIKLGLLELEQDPSIEMACYYLDNAIGKVEVTQVDVNSRGLTRRWPDGFFDQAERDMMDLALRIRHGA